MSGQATPSRALSSIQMLRGIAATAVVIYHASLIGADYTHVHVFAAATEPGKFGVNLFFILSGFIICFAHSKDVGRPEAIGRYAWRRFTRIYPAYWLFSIVYVGAALAGLGKPDFSWDAPHLLSSLLLVKLTPETVLLPLKVAWTLFYEMQFYILFATFLISRRLGIGLFALWGLYLVAAFVTGFTDRLNLWSPWHFHFLIGCALFLIYRKTPLAMAAPLIAAGLAGIVFAAVATDFALTPLEGVNHRIMPILALACGALVLGCLVLEHWKGRPSLPSVEFLGDASYSIYLVHSAAISALFVVARKLGLLGLLPVEAWFFIAAVAGVAGGAIAYVLVERPLLRLIRGFSRPQKRLPEPGLAR